MRLCDRDIKKYLAEGKITMTPAPSEESISGLTVDVRLGHKFRVFNDHSAPYIDLSGKKSDVTAQLEKVMSDEIDISDDEEFLLSSWRLSFSG